MPALTSRKTGPSPLSPAACSASAWTGKRFVLLASRFNLPMTQVLVEGAQAVLRRAGVSPRAMRVVWVPGSFELPAAAARLAASRPKPDAIVALGVLIRGQTPQYEVIASAVARGLAEVGARTGVPVTFGVIVAETAAQARARAGGAAGNRGEEGAVAALEMARLFDRLGRGKR